MTVVAGVFSRGEKDFPDAELCEKLTKIISRNQRDKVVTCNARGFFLAMLDSGAFGESGFVQDPSGGISVLAGEPLLENNIPWQSRTQDLAILHESWRQGNWSLLQKTRGVFCAVHYEPESCHLYLMTDKLGVRPLYYWANAKYIIFASALRILEGLEEVPKQMDIRAITEMTVLGYPLDDRTPYVSIVRLKSAEIVGFGDNSIKRWQYWRWDKIDPAQSSEAEMLDELYAHFITSVGIRIRQDTATIAFLSGGLDSRCITAALRDRNVAVHTFNFARSGWQDRLFAAEFAKVAGTCHHQGALVAPSEDDTFTTMLAAELSLLNSENPWPQRPQLVWSGDGGSVGLGHVYLSSEVAELLRKGQRSEAIDTFLKEQSYAVVTKLFNKDIACLLQEVPKQGILAELEGLQCEDAARAYHIFLMLNDQRWHVSHHYENIDIHRLEFQLPFFDSRFVEAILRFPIDLCLNHRLYMKWLEKFPAMVRSVAWQSYPGHEACPIPIPSSLVYQWDPNSSTKRRRLSDLKDARGLLRAVDFPYPLLNRKYLRLVTWIHRTGVRDYGYAVKTAKIYYKYWRLSGGTYSLP